MILFGPAKVLVIFAFFIFIPNSHANTEFSKNLTDVIFIDYGPYKNKIVKREIPLEIYVPALQGGLNIHGALEVLEKLRTVTPLKIVDGSRKPNFFLVISDDFATLKDHPVIKNAVKIAFNSDINYWNEFIKYINLEKKCFIRNNYEKFKVIFTIVFINPKISARNSAECLSRGILSSLGLLNIGNTPGDVIVDLKTINKRTQFEIREEVYRVIKFLYQSSVTPGLGKELILKKYKAWIKKN